MVERTCEMRLAGKPPAGRVYGPLFVGGDVDAVELVVGDVAVEPLNLRAQIAQDSAQGL